jgi:hypothetical protein
MNKRPFFEKFDQKNQKVEITSSRKSYSVSCGLSAEPTLSVPDGRVPTGAGLNRSVLDRIDFQSKSVPVSTPAQISIEK